MTVVTGKVGIGPGWPPLRGNSAGMAVSVRYVERTLVGDVVTEPVAAPIRIARDGSFEVTLEPGYVIWSVFYPGYKAERGLEIPDSETADYESLVEVDPATLEPLAPIPPNAQEVLDEAEAAIGAAAAAEAAQAAAEAAQAAAEAVPTSNDGIVAALIDDAESDTAAALSGSIVSVGDAPFRRGRSVVEFGAVGGNAALDTPAFQAALNAADGTVFVPASPSGARYVINAPLTIPQSGTARSVVGLGNGMVEIEYTGAGFMFDSVSADPADPTDSPIDLFFENLRIDGYNNTTSDGAFRIDGAYFVNFDRVEVRRFLKAGAIGIKLHNSFSIDVARSNVLSITNGIGIQVGGTLQQVTNFHLHDFILQRSGVGLDIATGITGGGLQVDNGAIRANDAQIGVRMTGKYADMKFGPALHIESETVVGSNTTKGFLFSGATLFASQVIFDGIDFYNVKTLLDLDGSAGTLRGVSIDHIYATALPGLAGTAFDLTNIFFGFRVGSYHIASAEYTTIWAVTNVELADPIIFGSADAQSVIGSPSTSNIQRWPVWLLDSAASEAVGVVFRPPRSWAAFAVDVIYTNAGAGSGNVSFRGDVISRASGATLAAPTAATEVVSIAPAADGVKTVELQASVAITDDETVLINAIRLGASGNDTLANDIGIIAIVVRRVG